ncbi:MAG TPA: hypothetical protein DCG48_05865 [Rhodospirillaceae bacterium]|nr:hypothetical protein [Rhodospirillaceae bacterium]
MKSLARLRVFAAAGLIWLALGLPAALAQFVGGIDDLPLMPGLTDIPDAGVVFETPAGRIVEAQALMGAVDRKAVLDFYDATLPQLGWSKTARGQYGREGETLNLEFPAGPLPTVRFRLAPGG